MRFSSIAAYSSFSTPPSSAPGQQGPAYGSVVPRASNMSAPLTTSIIPPSSRINPQYTARAGSSQGPLPITVTPTTAASLAARGRKPGGNNGGGGNSRNPQSAPPKPTNSKGEVCAPLTTTYTGSTGAPLTSTYNPCLPTNGARRGPVMPWKGWL
jgi:hypothetical protein